MKVIIGLAIFFSCLSCSQNDGYNRGYVISKSQLETEKEAMASEEMDSH
jgi:hypothetical protein